MIWSIQTSSIDTPTVNLRTEPTGSEPAPSLATQWVRAHSRLPSTSPSEQQTTQACLPHSPHLNFNRQPVVPLIRPHSSFSSTHFIAVHRQVCSTVTNMGGPKVSRFFCSMCDANFPSKKALLQHQANHPEPEPAKHNCETCNWPFDDSLALENHYMASGHGVLPFPCDNCSKRFLSEHALNEHRKSCAKPVQCRNCSVIFPSEAAYNKHRRFPSPCADGLNKPAKTKDATKKPAFVDVDAPARQATVLCYEVRDSASSSDVV